MAGVKVYGTPILLGFETPTGQPVQMDLHHLAIFGMTRLSGKTTALEAFITRSGLSAIAFRTKRGETGFTTFHTIPPYYKPRTDWYYLESLINVALGEKVKFEPGMRGAIMRVVTGCKDLREIQRRCEEQLTKAKRAFMQDVYTKLAEYLKMIVPEMSRHTFSDTVKLERGVNVMDLVGMRRETQSLVIASTMEYAMANMEDVVVVVPEAWEHLPQSRVTPVTLSAESFIRKGASLGNWLWIDSQDIGGLDKRILRQVDNWLLGRMKEAHEVERVIKQLLGHKIRPEEIQMLPLGHFYAAIGNRVARIYVLPSGVPEEAGRQVAMGKLTPEQLRDRYIMPRILQEDEDLVWKERYEKEVPALKERIAKLEGDLVGKETARLEAENRELGQKLVEARATIDINLAKGKAEAEKIGQLEAKLGRYEDLEKALHGLFPEISTPPAGWTESTPAGQVSVQLIPGATEVVLKPAQVQTVELSAVQGLPGKILQVVIEDPWGKDGQEFTFSQIKESLKERGWNPGTANINIAIGELVKRGVIIKEAVGKYRLPPKVKIIYEKG